jgi:hypothetical protein
LCRVRGQAARGRRPSARPSEEACPAAPGMKDWQPAAWSPRTELLEVPRQNLCTRRRRYILPLVRRGPIVTERGRASGQRLLHW